MLRRMLSAAAVLFVLAGFVFAERYQGLITKIDKDEITIKVRKDKTDKEGEEKKFKVSKDVKISKKGKEKGDDPTSVSVADFTKAVEKAADGKLKGVPATIETEGEGTKEAVTKITFGGGKRGGKKGGDK